MISIIALWLAAVFAPDSQITWLSVSPVSDRTEVVIRVDGEVTHNSFMMDNGRLVVDITGVAAAPVSEQAINRGGIAKVRIGQFQPNVARVVIELSGPAEYTVVKEVGALRVRFPNRAGLFEPYSAALTRARSGSNSDGSAGASAPNADAGKAQIDAPRPAVVTPSSRVTTISPTSGIVPQTQGRECTPSGKIEVIFNEQPLSQVLGMISEAAGRTILSSPQAATKPITAEFRSPGVNWCVMLESILEANALSQRTLATGVIIVEDVTAQLARAVTQQLVVANMPLKYLKADSIVTAIESILTPDVGKVAVNSAANALIITDTPEGIERIRQTIPLLDQPSVQVEINATVAFIDRTALEALGVVYDLKDSRGNQLRGLANNQDPATGAETPQDVVLLSGNSVAALGNANFRVAGPALTLATSLVLGRHTLISFLEALQTVSLSDIEAKPMVTIQDNYRAHLQVGQRTPIRTIDAGAAGGGNGAPRAAVRFEDTGIILDVVPHVIGDQIKLEMHLERSGVGAVIAGVDFTFDRQAADVTVTVMDGQTTAIGGLTIVEKTRSRSGIPFLMDLPVIGALFRNDREQETKRDLLMLVRPHIVREQ